jgi:endo-1,4-beta-xylanase
MARLSRSSLMVASGLLAGAGTLVTAQNATRSAPPNVTVADGLHSLMVKAGKLYFGTAADVNSFNDTQYMAIMSNTSDFGMITADNSFTWDGTESTLGKFNYTNADLVVAKTKENRQMMRCHALVWQKALPTWGRPSFIFS